MPNPEKDESHKYQIGDTVYWYLSVGKGKERHFYKSIVEAYGEPPHEGGGRGSNNHKVYQMKVLWVVLKKDKKLIYAEKDPFNDGPFIRNPRRAIVNQGAFPTEAAMFAEIKSFYGVELDETQGVYCLSPLSTLVDKPDIPTGANREEVILIDNEKSQRTSFPSLNKLAKHVGKKEEWLLKAAIYTRWISPRYQMDFPCKVYEPLPFATLAKDKKKVIYTDAVDAWRRSKQGNSTWDPNDAYLEAVKSIERGSYHFEYHGSLYQLVNEDGSYRQSRWVPDIKKNDPFREKVRKIKAKALEVNRSPFVIALTTRNYHVDVRSCRHPVLNDREVELIYRATYDRNLDLSMTFAP